jgi:hypothetical protein
MRDSLNTYQILFQDSPEYFYIKDARMICVDGLLMFRTFNDEGCIGVQYYPLQNIHRVKVIMED